MEKQPFAIETSNNAGKTTDTSKKHPHHHNHSGKLEAWEADALVASRGCW